MVEGLQIAIVPRVNAIPAALCEPVVPFLQVMAPALALSGSFQVLVGAVILKSALFAFFERRLPHLRAAWRIFLGNVLTSLVGLFVAALIGSAPGVWLVGVPVVYLLCMVTARRLVKATPLGWLSSLSPAALAAAMTGALLVSCVLFVAGTGILAAHQLILYWIVKVAAISLALFASVMLTTVWEEWVIWRLSVQPEGTAFFASVLRTNLYVLLLVMLVPAIMILPRRMKSPDFLGQLPDFMVGKAGTIFSSELRLGPANDCLGRP